MSRANVTSYKQIHTYTGLSFDGQTAVERFMYHFTADLCYGLSGQAKQRLSGKWCIQTRESTLLHESHRQIFSPADLVLC